MPVKRRTTRQRREQWSEEHRQALILGIDYWWTFDNFEDVWDMDAAAACWADVGEELVADAIVNRPGTRPVGWWMFERGMDRIEARSMTPEEQARYLRRHRLLTADERRSMEARDAA